LVKIKLIGFDSMGTRGMATVIDIDGFKVFIDPGVNIAPRRYGLPPHPLELEALEKHLDEIHRETIDSNVLIITHYHRDHYLYREGEAEYYRGKIVLIKDPNRKINYSQRVRAHILLNKLGIKDIASKVKPADNETFDFNNIKIRFSKPLPHGARGSKLGYTLAVSVETPYGVIVHASDVQGPMDREALEEILRFEPDILIISGPPTYFEGLRINSENINEGLRNMLELAERVKEGSTLIVDHHLLRDLNYYSKVKHIVEACSVRNVRFITAAEFMGLEIKQLEAMRRTLWEENH